MYNDAIVRTTFFYILLLLIIFFVLASSTDARSGCCSHHGGVRGDGCGCNDGTQLSNTCAPYYNCTSNSSVQEEIPMYIAPTEVVKIPTPTFIRISTKIPTKKPTIKPSRIPTRNVVKKVVNKKSKPTPTPQRSVLQLLFGLN